MEAKENLLQEKQNVSAKAQEYRKVISLMNSKLSGGARHPPLSESFVRVQGTALRVPLFFELIFNSRN